MARLFLTFIGFFLFVTAHAQDANTIDWNADLDYLAKELPEKHYDFFTTNSKEDFLLGIAAIKAAAKNLEDFEIALKTQQLIAKFGDSHTRLNFLQLIDKSQLLPIHSYWFGDGLYILGTTAENKELLGSKLLSINGTPIAAIVDSLNTISTIDNEAMTKVSTPQYLPLLQILKYFDFVGSDNVVELEVLKGAAQNQTYRLKPSEMNRGNRVMFKPDSVAFCWKNEKAFFTDFYSPDDKIYYMLYNICGGKESELEYGSKERAESLPSFNEFTAKALSVISSNPVDKIVFDLRFNGGGNSRQGTVFIEKLAGFLEANPTVKSYVVLGRQTFSSAILNAMDFKQLTNAVFVGEETAGKPNHFGEIVNFQLPNSKLYVTYSTKYFKRIDEDVNTIKPDRIVEMNFSDFAKGVDPVYEWIKEQ